MLGEGGALQVVFELAVKEAELTEWDRRPAPLVPLYRSLVMEHTTLTLLFSAVLTIPQYRLVATTMHPTMHSRWFPIGSLNTDTASSSTPALHSAPKFSCPAAHMSPKAGPYCGLFQHHLPSSG